MSSNKVLSGYSSGTTVIDTPTSLLLSHNGSMISFVLGKICYLLQVQKLFMFLHALAHNSILGGFEPPISAPASHPP